MDYRDHTPEELESLLAYLFCKGNSPAEIKKILRKDYHFDVVPTRIWQKLALAANKLRFRYLPVIDRHLSDAIKAKYGNASLNRVDVVNSLLLSDLAFRTAEMLLELIREHHRGSNEVHIGFAGGGTLLEVARSLGELLRDPERTRDIPHRLVFHSMVAGWNVDEPEQDPNSFSTVLGGNHATMDFDIRFVGLHAPGMVPKALDASLRKLDGIREAFDAADQIDVIVTSGGRWECQHSSLFRLYSKYADGTRQMLQDAGCVGDLMWSPLGPDGEIDLTSSEIRMFTLMRISQLHDFILKTGKDNKRRHVLLALGMCRNCHTPKAEILRTVLNLAPDKRFITHLVCDCRTANRVLTP